MRGRPHVGPAPRPLDRPRARIAPAWRPYAMPRRPINPWPHETVEAMMAARNAATAARLAAGGEEPWEAERRMEARRQPPQDADATRRMVEDHDELAYAAGAGA